MEKIYSTGEVAQMLGIPRHKIEYAIANGHLAEATLRFLDKRCFTNDDIRTIADYFGVQEIREGGQECSSSST
jgi:DNA-binding transcriptional MerR regulator